MSVCCLPLYTTTRLRLQQIARTLIQLPHRHTPGIPTSRYSNQKFGATMGAQKIPSEEGYAQTPLNTIKVYKHRGMLLVPPLPRQFTNLVHLSCIRLPNRPLHLRLHPRLPRLLHLHRRRRRPNAHKPALDSRTRPLRSLAPSPRNLQSTRLLIPRRPQQTTRPLPPRQRSNDAAPRNSQKRNHESLHHIHKSRWRGSELHSQWPFTQLPQCSHSRHSGTRYSARRKEICDAFTD